jgi:hypothetical protein
MLGPARASGENPSVSRSNTSPTPRNRPQLPAGGNGWNSGNLLSVSGGTGWHMSPDTIMTTTQAQMMLDSSFGLDVKMSTPLYTVY